MRSKFPNNALFWVSISWSICKSQIRSWDQILKSIIRQFWPHDWSVDLLINIIGQIQPHEQTQFWPHDRKFDLLKKLNFDLMKFDLLTLSLSKDSNYFHKNLFIFITLKQGSQTQTGLGAALDSLKASQAAWKHY